MDTAQLERVYRAEAPRITAALAARIGDVGLAADAVQDVATAVGGVARKIEVGHARQGATGGARPALSANVTFDVQRQVRLA